MRSTEEINELLRSKSFINLYRNRAGEYFDILLGAEGLLLNGQELPEELGVAQINDGNIIYTRRIKDFGFNLKIKIVKEIGKNDMEVQVDVIQKENAENKEEQALISIRFPYQRKNGFNIVRESDIEIFDYSSIILLKNGIRKIFNGENNNGKKFGPEINSNNWHRRIVKLFQVYKNLKSSRRKEAELIKQKTTASIIEEYNNLGTNISRRQFEIEHPEIQAYKDGMLHINNCGNAIDSLMLKVPFPHKESCESTDNFLLINNRLICYECGNTVNAEKIGEEQFDFLRESIVKQGSSIHEKDIPFFLEHMVEEKTANIKNELTRRLIKEEYETRKYEILFLLGYDFSTLYERDRNENQRFALIKAYSRFTGEKDFSVSNPNIREDVNKRLKQMKTR